MNFAETFKSEVFRPIVTLVIPGAVAIGPYIIVAGYYVPRIQKFWDEHPSAFVAIVTIFGIAAGLVLEDIGLLIETGWDRVLDNKKNKEKGADSEHFINWEKYLKLELKDEIIAQRYLRIVLTWMKFELAMFPALVFLWAGLLWVNCIYNVWSELGFVLLSLFILGLASFLLYNSYLSAKNLAQKRKWIIEAVEARAPKGT